MSTRSRASKIVEDPVNLRRSARVAGGAPSVEEPSEAPLPTKVSAPRKIGSVPTQFAASHAALSKSTLSALFYEYLQAGLFDQAGKELPATSMRTAASQYPPPHLTKFVTSLYSDLSMKELTTFMLEPHDPTESLLMYTTAFIESIPVYVATPSDPLPKKIYSTIIRNILGENIFSPDSNILKETNPVTLYKRLLGQLTQNINTRFPTLTEAAQTIDYFYQCNLSILYRHLLVISLLMVSGTGEVASLQVRVSRVIAKYVSRVAAQNGYAGALQLVGAVPNRVDSGGKDVYEYLGTHTVRSNKAAGIIRSMFTWNTEDFTWSEENPFSTHTLELLQETKIDDLEFLRSFTSTVESLLATLSNPQLNDGYGYIVYGTEAKNPTARQEQDKERTSGLIGHQAKLIKQMREGDVTYRPPIYVEKGEELFLTVGMSNEVKEDEAEAEAEQLEARAESKAVEVKGRDVDTEVDNLLMSLQQTRADIQRTLGKTPFVYIDVLKSSSMKALPSDITAGTWTAWARRVVGTSTARNVDNMLDAFDVELLAFRAVQKYVSTYLDEYKQVLDLTPEERASFQASFRSDDLTPNAFLEVDFINPLKVYLGAIRNKFGPLFIRGWNQFFALTYPPKTLTVANQKKVDSARVVFQRATLNLDMLSKRQYDMDIPDNKQTLILMNNFFTDYHIFKEEVYGNNIKVWQDLTDKVAKAQPKSTPWKNVLYGKEVSPAMEEDLEKTSSEAEEGEDKAPEAFEDEDVVPNSERGSDTDSIVSIPSVINVERMQQALEQAEAKHAQLLQHQQDAKQAEETEAKLNLQLQKLNMEVETKVTQLLNLEGTLSGLRKQNEDLVSQIAAHQSEYKLLEERIQAMDMTVDGSETQAENARLMGSELEGLEQRYTEKQTLLAQLTEQIKALQAQKEQLEEDNRQLATNKSELVRSIRVSTELRKTLEDQIRALKITLEEEKKKLDALFAMEAAEESKLASTTQQVKNKEDELARVAVTAARAEQQGGEEAIRTLGAEMSLISTENQALQRKLANLQAEVVRLRKEKSIMSTSSVGSASPIPRSSPTQSSQDSSTREVIFVDSSVSADDAYTMCYTLQSKPYPKEISGYGQGSLRVPVDYISRVASQYPDILPASALTDELRRQISKAAWAVWSAVLLETPSSDESKGSLNQEEKVVLVRQWVDTYGSFLPNIKSIASMKASPPDVNAITGYLYQLVLAFHASAKGLELFTDTLAVRSHGEGDRSTHVLDTSQGYFSVRRQLFQCLVLRDYFREVLTHNLIQTLRTVFLFKAGVGSNNTPYLHFSAWTPSQLRNMGVKDTIESSQDSTEEDTGSEEESSNSGNIKLTSRWNSPPYIRLLNFLNQQWLIQFHTTTSHASLLLSRVVAEDGRFSDETVEKVADASFRPYMVRSLTFEEAEAGREMVQTLLQRESTDFALNQYFQKDVLPQDMRQSLKVYVAELQSLVISPEEEEREEV